MVTTLRIKKNYDNDLELAVKWYSIISILNNFKWSPLQVKLMAFTAVKGDISSGGRKEAFCTFASSVKTSVANTISDMYQAGFLVKNKRRITVNPQLLLNFEGDICAKLILEHVREA